MSKILATIMQLLTTLGTVKKKKNSKKQAGAELGQAQLKLVLDFTRTELGKISGQILTNLKNSSG